MGGDRIKEFIDTNINLISFFALILNFVTLLVVLHQTKISKDTLKLTNQSFLNDKNIREIQILPKMNFVIHVQIRLGKWLETLNKIKKEIELVLEDKNSDALKIISEYGERTPEGLIDRYMYEHAPNWLSEIYESGAQYYYSCIVSLDALWDDHKNIGRLEASEDVLDNFNVTIYSLQELLNFIDNAIPQVFLNTPASLSVERFMRKE